MLIDYITKPCPQCGYATKLSLEKSQYYQWLAGIPIQEAFRDTPAPIRELLITGIHPECWKKIFDPASPNSEDEE